MNSDIVQKAREFATQAHAGQKRKHGTRPYIYHPGCVATYLEEKGYTGDIIAAAWLHDVLEDCGVSYNTLESEFGPTIAMLVCEVSHPALKEKLSRSQRWEVYLSHYGNASNLGKVLKLADRYCNLCEYRDFWDEVPARDKKFLNKIYLQESSDMLDYLYDANHIIGNDVVYIMNELDELFSEER